MMQNTDVLIVGGSAGGLSTANSVNTWYPGKKITIVRNVPYTVVPCGIPYIYGHLQEVAKDKIPDEGFLKKGFEILTDSIIDVDRSNKVASFSDGEEIAYEKMVIAVGSHPTLPMIDGINLKNVFPIKKDPKYLETIKLALEESKDVVVIGGGFIGVEMAEQIKLKGNYNVTLVEALPHCLLAACEEEAGIKVEQELEKIGVQVRTNTRTEAIIGSDKVEEIRLSSGDKIKADIVIIGIGAYPNIDLAAKIGLKTDKKMGILVDEYMRTSDPDIFACGDCCSKLSGIDGKAAAIRLASVAATEGMIAGSNLYDLKRKAPGTVGAFATKVGDIGIGSAGFTEEMCKKEGLQYYKGEMTAPDRHPGSLPGCTPQSKVKLLFDRTTDKIIGGHVISGVQAADMVNIFAVSIQQGLTADNIATSQYATHPLLTGSPLVYQVMWAAENALLNREK